MLNTQNGVSRLEPLAAPKEIEMLGCCRLLRVEISFPCRVEVPEQNDAMKASKRGLEGRE